MQQAMHILRKDVRHLWIEIAVVLAATGLFVFTHTHQGFWQYGTHMPQTVAGFLASFLLPVSWWLLIVRAVHGETLTGDSEFWTTRPYSWKSLLAAKITVVALFINLPMLAAQAIILEASGFSVRAELSSLLWNQVLLSVACFLPVAAIAALTTGLVQFLIVSLVCFAVSMLLSFRLASVAAIFVGGLWGGLEWIRSYYDLLLLAVAAPALLLWQYSRRRTLAGRVAAGAVLAALALGMPIPWNGAFAIQSRLSRQPIPASSVRAGFNSSFAWMTRALIERDGRVSLSVPLELSGLADNWTAKPQGLSFAIQAREGAWRPEQPWTNVSSTGQLITLRTIVDGSFYQRVKDQPVSLRGDLYLTIYGSRLDTSVAFNGQRLPVPGLGLCSGTRLDTIYLLNCVSAMRPGADLVGVQFGRSAGTEDYSFRRRVSYSPFPAEMTIDPLVPFATYSPPQKTPLDSVTVSAREPIAFIRAPLAIDGLRLGAYEVKLK